MKMKILSPAGDMESLKMAVFNGADEVYLGVKDFNARNIEGFSLETLKEAVDFAHVFGVKVNLTVNILFADDEIQSALDLVVDAYNLGVDSFIIQDVGLASLIHKNYPQIEMHASTQMGIHNLEGVKVIEKLGFKRVVLARETPLDEILRIKKNSDIEIEYFCHGALCVSFSGNCYLSSYLHGASGNRGKCKQLCRLPYSFRYNNREIKNGYLLSAKDFNMINKLKELEEVGVDVLKIEGRARRPYYVGVATRVYKQALNGQKYDLEDLKLAFNRGYTEGYFNGNGDIISNKQNHIGIEIGKVEKFKAGKRFNEIFISSNIEISSKSTLKFLSDKEEVVVTAFDISKVGQLYRITTTQTVKVGSKVCLISDNQKEQEMLNFRKRKPVEIEIVAKENEHIFAEFKIGNETHVVEGEMCLPAIKQPITIDELKANFNKSELFEADLVCKIGKIFLPKQKINEFRRNVFAKIESLLIATNRTELKKVVLKIGKKPKEFDNFELVENIDTNYTAKNVIYAPEKYDLKNVKEFIDVCRLQNKTPYLNLPNFALKNDVEMLREIVEKTKINIIANNLYAMGFDVVKVVGGGMNIYNSFSAKYFALPYMTAEGGEFKMPYMTLLHCPMKANLAASCVNCPYKNGYEYVMENGRRLKLKKVKMSSCLFYLVD